MDSVCVHILCSLICDFCKCAVAVCLLMQYVCRRPDILWHSYLFRLFCCVFILFRHLVCLVLPCPHLVNWFISAHWLIPITCLSSLSGITFVLVCVNSSSTWIIFFLHIIKLLIVFIFVFVCLPRHNRDNTKVQQTLTVHKKLCKNPILN